GTLREKHEIDNRLNERDKKDDQDKSVAGNELPRLVFVVKIARNESADRFRKRGEPDKIVCGQIEQQADGETPKRRFKLAFPKRDKYHPDCKKIRDNAFEVNEMDQGGLNDNENDRTKSVFNIPVTQCAAATFCSSAVRSAVGTWRMTKTCSSEEISVL